MSTIGVWTGPAPRGGNAIQPRTFGAQAFHLTRSWGSNPATGVIEYVGSGPGVTTGAKINVTVGGKTWWGVVKSDVIKEGSDGRSRTLEFADVREYLQWDYAFAAFNQRKDLIVDGVLRRRYWHIMPANFDAGLKTYTDAPLTADAIVSAMLGFTKRAYPDRYSVETEWRNRSHVSMLLYPVFDLDFLGGRTLAAALSEIGEKLGLVFGLQETIDPFGLRWVRKGDGDLPVFEAAGGGLTVFPPKSDNHRLGGIFSGHPNKVRIVGGRNCYQVMDVPMERDWLPAWERFLDPFAFEQDIYLRGSDTNGVPFPATPNDPEGIVGRMRAAALAKTITVRGYAELRAASRLPGEDPHDAEEWIDPRKYSGRMRADMPAELYLSALVFRAFRPSEFSFPNYSGKFVPLLSMEILPKLITRVSHDPVTGLMTAYPELPLDGAGYLIAQGYQVGQDAFRTLDPGRFNLADWLGRQDLWQAITFAIDDTGEGVPFVITEEPVIRSADLFVQGDGSDYPTLNARFSLRVPEVRACLVFAAEPFQYVRGRGSRLAAETVANLNGEFVTSANGGTGLTEIFYADGQTASQKAATIADAILRRPFVYQDGGYRIQGIVNTSLTQMIDRVAVHVTPQGQWEEVDFTAERRIDRFVPERRFDRITRERFLLPGQEELREQARQLRLTAAALSANPAFRGRLIEYVRGSEETPALIKSAPSTPATLPAGTPVFRAPTAQAAAHAQTAAETVFLGVTTRAGEVATGNIPVRSSGCVYALVQGPVNANDPVGRAATDGFGPLVTGSAVPVGQAMAAITDASVKLIPVRIGAGGGSTVAATGVPFEVTPAGLNMLKVNAASFLALGLNATEIFPIDGLDTPFTVEEGDLIWLEVWFDFMSPGGVGGDVYAARIARGPRWLSWPSTVQVVQKHGTTPADTIPDDTVLTAIVGQDWVGVDSGAVAGVRAELRKRLNGIPAFPGALRRQWRAFVLIALVGDGGKVAAQCLKTHLQLTWFVDGGVPVQYPVPAGAPFIRLPQVVIQVAGNTATLTVPNWPTATLRYRIVPADDNSPTTAASLARIYAAPFNPNDAIYGTGARKLQALAQLGGFVDGPVAEVAI